jgi:hypothetical protein
MDHASVCRMIGRRKHPEEILVKALFQVIKDLGLD